jgi:ligand-binding SRPBCC domain-containing protein
LSHTYIFRSSQLINKPIENVFEFFADACNLEKLTPLTLKFQILSDLPILMKTGTLIDYKITIHGMPVKWKTEILEWMPPYRFIDIQRKGPYKLWRHTHTFKTIDGKTLMEDVVEYEMPFGIFGRLAHPLFVKKEIEQIFDFRKKIIESIFLI